MALGEDLISHWQRTSCRLGREAVNMNRSRKKLR